MLTESDSCVFNVRILREQTRASIESIRTSGVKSAEEVELALLVHRYLLQLPEGEESV